MRRFAVAVLVVQVTALSPAQAPAVANAGLECGTVITEDTTLTADIVLDGDAAEFCLSIGADGVVLDGGGYTISGGYFADAVVLVRGRSDVTIRNLHTISQGTGILIDGAVRVHVDDIETADFGGVGSLGVRIVGSSQVSIVNNTLFGREFGIHIRASNDVQVESNTVASWRGGMWIVDSSDIGVKNNTIGGPPIDSTEGGGAQLDGLTLFDTHNSLIEDNVILAVDWYGGIPLFVSSDSTGNEFIRNHVSPIEADPPQYLGITDESIGPGTLGTANTYLKVTCDFFVYSSPANLCSPPSIAIDDVTVTEGDSGTTEAIFTVSMSPSTSWVSVTAATADGTATVGADYLSTGPVELRLRFRNDDGNFPVGYQNVTATFTVKVVGDLIEESDETFFVNLSSPSGAAITDHQGKGSILDDDSLATSSNLANTFDYPFGFRDCSRALWNYRVQVKGDFLDPAYGGSRKHPGEDWNRGSGDADLYDPVCAVGNGTVVASSNYYEKGNRWGNIVVIEHKLPDGSTWWSQYAHLDIRTVGVDDTVTRGDQIGTIGKGCNATRSECPGFSAHLHFEIRRQDVAPDNWPNNEQTIRNQYVDPTDVSSDVNSEVGFIEAHRFGDTAGSIFLSDILWMAAEGITRGCNPPLNDRFCPDSLVTRGQMAAFLVRALGLTDRLVDPFVDDDGSIFEADIERLAAAGITRGCDPPLNNRFCPDEPVTRGQMAAFLVRALGYLDDGGGNLFVDDDGSVFEADIDRLGTAGVTRGCNPPLNDMFCPDDYVTRGQMAAFLHRALG